MMTPGRRTSRPDLDLLRDVVATHCAPPTPLGSPEVAVASRRSRSRALLWGVLAMFACDGGYEAGTVVLVVRVEPTVQVATAFPAQVLVGFDSSGSGFVVFRIGFLCAPPSAPFVVTAQFSEPTGNAPSAVDAWVIPVDSGTPPTCGPLPVPQPVTPPPPGSAGVRTSGQVVVLGGCGSGEVRSATLVVAANEPSGAHDEAASAAGRGG
jgi:hypothetical protein